MKILLFTNRDIDIELIMERQPNGLYGYQRKMTGPRIKGEFVSKFSGTCPKIAEEGSFNLATSMLKELDKDSTYAVDYDGSFAFPDMKKENLIDYCHENGLSCMNGARIAAGNDGQVWMVPLAISPEEWIEKYWGRFILAEEDSYACLWEEVNLVDLSSFDDVISKYGLDTGVRRDIYITDQDFYFSTGSTKSIHTYFGSNIAIRRNFSDIKLSDLEKK